KVARDREQRDRVGGLVDRRHDHHVGAVAGGGEVRVAADQQDVDDVLVQVELLDRVGDGQVLAGERIGRGGAQRGVNAGRCGGRGGRRIGGRRRGVAGRQRRGARDYLDGDARSAG